MSLNNIVDLKVLVFAELKKLKKLEPYLESLKLAITQAAKEAENRINLAKSLETLTNTLSDQDYTFLYNHKKNLFCIGYSIERQAVDNYHYDTLCSEARTLSYVSIA